MARTNPEVERLQRELDLLRRANERLRVPPDPYPVSGCGDNSCQVAQPKGMATNGGCRCDERTLRRALAWYQRFTASQRAAIEDLIQDRRERGWKDDEP